MTRNLTLSATDRLLVFAPHPDDETLATGELIQLAVRVGAAVRVVFATDGDNNPWPQRWFERRLRIGPEERARWGERRRGEARSALEKLGVDAASARFLGWSDLGLTERLITDDSAIDALAGELEAFVPTHVAMPSLRDRHPDHGALRVMVDLAMAKARSHSVRLGYVVHGRTADTDGWRLADDASRHLRKQDALMAHASQTGLSRRRLLRWADQPESFDRAETESASPPATSSDRILRIPLLPANRFWRQHDLLIVLDVRGKSERARVRLPRLLRAQDDRKLASGLCGGRVNVELVSGVLQITFVATIANSEAAYVKIERTWPRLIIFDADTWQRLADFPTVSASEAQSENAVRVPQRASV
ncbi:MAG: PIG-L deacetylase family protein [Rhodanobacteraceae bacterium]